MIKPHKELPHSIEAEESLLSCCFLDGNEAVSRAMEAGITRDSFYDARNGLIYATAVDLFNHHKPVDVSVVAEELKTTKQLDAIGGISYLVQVSARTPTMAHLTYYIDKVRENSILRNVIRTSTANIQSAYEFSGGLDEFVDGVEKSMMEVTQSHIADRVRPASAIAPHSSSILLDMIGRKGGPSGVLTGFKDLDVLTWGLQPADIIILAGRPSTGKTSIAMNIVEHAALQQKVHCLVFSLEMTANQLLQRMILCRARVNMSMLRQGLVKKGGDESQRIIKATDEIKAAPLSIDDSSGLQVNHLRARARRLHARQPLGLIAVDYLQLMAPATRDAPREQQVAEASRGLKALAKELNVPIIVLSQLNRLADKESRTPRLSDLRESGSIEQDADVVMMLSRPKDADENFQVAADKMDLYVAKQRNGPVGQIQLSFLRDITRFENYHGDPK